MEQIVWGAEIPVSGRPEWLGDDERVDVRWSGSDWYAEGVGRGMGAPVDCVSGWGEVTAIRLPQDHWAYPVINKGFTPWAGGDGGPADWDASQPVLFADESEHVSGIWNWSGCQDGPSARRGALIIGYRRKVEQDTPRPFAAGDWVVALADEIDIAAGNLYRMVAPNRFVDDNGDIRDTLANPVRPASPEEIAAHVGVIEPWDEPVARFDTVAELIDDLNDTIRLTKITRSDAKARMLDIPTLIVLGLLAEATDIERFEDFHGGLSDAERGIAEMAIQWARENG